jgi:hypothetical protein
MRGTGLDCAAKIMLPRITNKQTKRADLTASPPRKLAIDSGNDDLLGRVTQGGVFDLPSDLIVLLHACSKRIIQ